MAIRLSHDNVGSASKGKRSPKKKTTIMISGETPQQISERWKHRRAMAWITFVFDHILILYIVIYAQGIEEYISLINTFFAMSGSIIAAYIGFSTWDDINKKKQETNLEKTLVDNGAFDPPSNKNNESDER